MTDRQTDKKSKKQQKREGEREIEKKTTELYPLSFAIQKINNYYIFCVREREREREKREKVTEG